jgi:hypothetical protein
VPGRVITSPPYGPRGSLCVVERKFAATMDLLGPRGQVPPGLPGGAPAQKLTMDPVEESQIVFRGDHQSFRAAKK